MCIACATKTTPIVNGTKKRRKDREPFLPINININQSASAWTSFPYWHVKYMRRNRMKKKGFSLMILMMTLNTPNLNDKAFCNWRTPSHSGPFHGVKIQVLEIKMTKIFQHIVNYVNLSVLKLKKRHGGRILPEIDWESIQGVCRQK